MGRMFLERGFWGTPNWEKADILVFQGGSDIDPNYYGEKPIPGGSAGINKARDAFEVEMFGLAVERGKFLVGICRGAQLLNVLNGGGLWQDVTNHTKRHLAIDTQTKESFQVSSTHHQMMRISHEAEGQMLLMAYESDRKLSQKVKWFRGAKGQDPKMESEYTLDVEAVFYPHTRSFCFQPHPEHTGVEDCRNWFFNTLDDLMVEQSDEI